MEHPPGTIILPSNGFIRYTPFFHSLIGVEKPKGTHLQIEESGLVTQNLNRALREHFVGEWAWLQSDDHIFKPDLLLRLLDHQAPVVVPLVCRRSSPHHLVIGKEAVFEDEDTGRRYPAYESLAIADVPDEPFTVEIAGTAGMLVRREVFDAIGYPYFESTDGLYLNEDIEFSRKVRAAGFEILVDPKAHMGHMVSSTIWPI